MNTTLKVIGLCAVIAHGTGCAYNTGAASDSNGRYAETACETNGNGRQYRNPFLRQRNIASDHCTENGDSRSRYAEGEKENRDVTSSASNPFLRSRRIGG